LTKILKEKENEKYEYIPIIIPELNDPKTSESSKIQIKEQITKEIKEHTRQEA